MSCYDEHGMLEAADDRLAEAEKRISSLEAENRRMREALEDIAIYGCGMLNQPAAMNGPEEAWLRRRIGEYERRARAALSQEEKP